jgi:predicted alpha/beta-hydrolase family hydrolase
VLAPGASGSAEQRILVTVARRLEEAGFTARRIGFSTKGRSPSRGYVKELDAIRAARDGMAAGGIEALALVGRSFGGRLCVRLAAEEPPEALVVLGHPISPPGRPRPDDEAALAAVRCATLIIQGDRDKLGPLPVLQRIAAGNPLIDIVVIADAGHSLSAAQEEEAAEHVARWLASRLGSD